jgi:hypothetical protein
LTVPPPRPPLTRRGFVKLAFAAGVATTGGAALLESAPWLQYDRKAALARRPFEPAAAHRAVMRELVRCASLAASGHNSQPWKFALSEDQIELRPDLSRRLPSVDPEDRELWISLGCALENLLVAARASGHTPEVEYPGTSDVIRVRLTDAAPSEMAAFDAIFRRQNTRSEYDGRPIRPHSFDQLQAVPLEPGIHVRYALKPADRKVVADYVYQGNVQQFGDKAFLRELSDWVRFNKREALASLDGLYAPCTGSPQVPRWIGQLVLSGIKPAPQGDADKKKLATSSGAFVVASETESKTAWVRAGQVYERLALEMTSLDIRSAFMNQPIEVATIRSQFGTAIGLGSALPQLLVRFGYADLMPRSLRRPVEQLLV